MTARVSAGVPAGGEFAPQQREEADFDLAAAKHRVDTRGPVRPLHLQPAAYSTMHFTLDATRDQFDLDAPYQRAAGQWSVGQKQNLIRSLLMGVPTGSVLLNIRGALGSPHYTVVDGKQRIEAIRDFVDDKFPIPVTWPDPDDLPGLEIRKTESVEGWDVPGVRYSDLGDIFQRLFTMRPFPAMESHVKTVEEEAAIYRLINTSGTEQAADDLRRALAVERSLPA